MSKLPLTLGFFMFGGVGRDRKPVQRTRQSHPYSFDDYLSFENTDQPLANESLYTDRMSQHEPEKYEVLTRKHFNSTSNFWEGRSPDKIEAFLRDYCDEPNLQLVRVWTCCDQSSGADHWQFEFLSETRPLPNGYVAPIAKVKSKARKGKGAATQARVG
jgi:hypothetical protein